MYFASVIQNSRVVLYLCYFNLHSNVVIVFLSGQKIVEELCPTSGWIMIC